MIKQDIFNHDVKAQFKAAAKDRLYRFMMAEDKIKGAVVHATRMVQEMQANHNLGPLETLILGQAYIAGVLSCSGLKGKSRMSLNIQCSGPIKGFDVEANTFGEVRGYLKANPIEVKHPEQVKRLSALYGAEDMAEYFLRSEQIPTGFKLSVAFDNNDNVIGAGGIFLQALPGVDPDQVGEAEDLIQSVSSLGQSFAEGQAPEEVINDVFSPLHPKFLKNNRVEFFCRCNKERMEGYLKGMAESDRKDIRENGPFPLETRCHHCNSVYRFSKGELASLLA